MSVRINVGATFDARDLERAQRELDALKRSADTLGNRMTALGGSFQKVGGQIAGVGKTLSARVTAPIVGLGAASIAAFSTVEQGIAEIGKATGATGGDLDAFGENLRNVLRQVPEDANAVGTAMGDLNTRLGATGKELEGLTKLSLEFARVNNTDVVSATSTVGKLLNALEMDASDAEQVMDKLTFAAQRTGISAVGLAQNVLDAGPAFEELGFGLDKSIALFASFEAAGARPEEVIGSLNIAINRMAKDAGKLDELERGLLKPAELFDDLLASIADAPDILAATTIASEAFGSRVGAKVAEDIRAGRFEVEAFAEEIGNVDGVVRDTAAATETFKDRMGILKNETLLVGEAFGETLLPFVEQGLEKFKQLQKRFEEMSPEQREQIVRFLAIAAAIGPVLIVAGKLVSGIGAIIKAAVLLGKAMLFLAANPIGLAIVAIAALIAIGVAIWKNWDTIKEKAGEVWGSVKDSITRAWEGIKSAIRPIVNAVLGYYNALITGVERAINSIGRAINSLPSVKVPDWVPIYGGRSYSMPKIPNVSFPKIPMLADGGIVRSATLALIGEAGPEAVIPLDKLDQAAGGDTFVINVSGAVDPEGVARQIEKILRDSRRRTGGVLV